MHANHKPRMHAMRGGELALSRSYRYYAALFELQRRVYSERLRERQVHMDPRPCVYSVSCWEDAEPGLQRMPRT